MKNYQMTTVVKYIDILDNELSNKERHIKNSVEKYLHRIRKASTNANILDKLLA